MKPSNLEAEKEVRFFIHAISHDLQQPLSKILTISEMVVEKATGLDETSKDYLLRMHESAKHMKKLIDDLTEKATVSSDERS